MKKHCHAYARTHDTPRSLFAEAVFQFGARWIVIRPNDPRRLEKLAIQARHDEFLQLPLVMEGGDLHQLLYPA